jgi:hypothetical protein
VLPISPIIDGKLGRCLRFIECNDNETLVLDEPTIDAAYDLWLVARDNIHMHWMHETDPANLQPKVRPLNRKVADFLRENIPLDMEQDRVNRALDIVESPWQRRDEGRLRKWFETNEVGTKKAGLLIEKILRSGLEPFTAPEPLPPINLDDIELLVWMGITRAKDS